MLSCFWCFCCSRNQLLRVVGSMSLLRRWGGWSQWWQSTGWPDVKWLPEKCKASEVETNKERSFNEGSFKFRRLETWRHWITLLCFQKLTMCCLCAQLIISHMQAKHQPRGTWCPHVLSILEFVNSCMNICFQLHRSTFYGAAFVWHKSMLHRDENSTQLQGLGFRV